MTNSILIADDSEVIRRTLRNLLGGYKDLKVCGEAENGQDAIEKAHHLKPDLVLMDFSMPIMNGLDAASHLKKQSPKIPIVNAHHVQGQLFGTARLQSGRQPGVVERGKHVAGRRLRSHSSETGA